MKDLTGLKFGRLTVKKLHHKKQLYRNGKKDGNILFWECVCECGEIIYVSTGHLTSGHTQSCGCYKNDLLVKRVKKHGMSETRLNRIFRKMKQRCYNPNDHKYYCYGAKGITICDEWLNDFMNFYNWAICNGYKENLTIDRIDNNGNYEPDNCRWADYFTQANNKSNNHYITFNDKTYTLAEWCKILNIKDWKFHRARKKYNNDVEALKSCIV